MGILKTIKSFYSTHKKQNAYNIQNLSLINRGYNEDIFCSSKTYWQKISMMQQINYYYRVSPIFTAVRKISDAASQVPILVKNKDDKFDINDKVTNLLKFPNADVTRTEFIDSLISYFLITGNAFVQANGMVNRAPVELYVRPPQSVTIETDTMGYAEKYLVTVDNKMTVYKRQEVNGRWRFYNQDNTQELWHIRKFNPYYGNGSQYGMSDLQPIYLELEQFEKSNIHNLSMLEKGARLSGLLVVKGNLSDEEQEAVKSDFKNYFQGSQNTGGVLYSFGNEDSDMQFTPMSQSNKDMDFASLKKDIRNQIYVNLKIPLPLVSPDHMTMDNYQQSRLDLYQNAVLPVLDRILNELTFFLMPRFNTDQVLSYNQKNIPALQDRITQEIQNKQNSGVFTLNELRNMYDLEEYDAGNFIFKQNSESAVQGENPFFFPSQPNNDPSVEQRMFVDILKRQGFSESFINDQVKKIYGDGN